MLAGEFTCNSGCDECFDFDRWKSFKNHNVLE